jgi:hypothetical protein
MKLIRNETSFEVESFYDHGMDELDRGFDFYFSFIGCGAAARRRERQCCRSDL